MPGSSQPAAVLGSAEFQALSLAARRRKRELRLALCRGQVALADVVHDPLLRRQPVLQLLCICLTTRKSNLDTRTIPLATKPSRVVLSALYELGLTGDERLGSLGQRRRQALAERLGRHRKATWNLRAERETGTNPATDR